MNSVVTKRIISKQEAVVLLADLKLTDCTETIENVSISNSKKISAGDTDKSYQSKPFLQQYAKRPDQFEPATLHQYYHIVKNGIQHKANRKLMIPHFVGISGVPTFPVINAYARHTLIVHKPWRTYPTDQDWKKEFDAFIQHEDCPISARLSYERVMHRHYEKMTHYEPKATDGDHDENNVSKEDEELLLLYGLKQSEMTDFDEAIPNQIHKG